MRDIRFRGKALDGGFWEFGFYFEREQDAAGRIAHFITCPGGRTIEVDPETVGEWTGEFDKNGKRIWENDVVIWGTGQKGIVQFDRARFIVEGFYMQSFDETGDAFGEGLCLLDVIGNIHDNKNL